MIFRPENLTVSLTADGQGCSGLEKEVKKLKEVLYTESLQKGNFRWIAEQKNEGFKTSGQVQYVAVAGDFRKAGFAYTGALRILRTILNYDYLWMNLRVKGGAYGCMATFKRMGESYLVSYRDPHLKDTLQVYRALPQYLRNFQADEWEMTKYIIGAISELDVPLNASAKGELALAAYFSGVTMKDFQKERDEILKANTASIRGLAELIEAVLKENNFCVIGSEAAIEKDRDIFQTVEALIQA